MKGGIPVMHIIDNGIFKGFIPVNHHWVNDDPNTYFETCKNVNDSLNVRRIRKNRICPFDLKGYQVVRGQFLQSLALGPCITLSPKGINFNMGCVRKFVGIPFIQLLLHPMERKIAIRPCDEKDIYSIRWRLHRDKPLIGKSICCSYFMEALYQIMNWNPDYSYKIRGGWIARNSDQIIIFDLENAVAVISYEEEEKKKRLESYPEEWAVGFGLEFYEYHVRNAIFYETEEIWDAMAKSHAVNNSRMIQPVSTEDVQITLMKLADGAVGGNLSSGESNEHI